MSSQCLEGEAKQIKKYLEVQVMPWEMSTSFEKCPYSNWKAFILSNWQTLLCDRNINFLADLYPEPIWWVLRTRFISPHQGSPSWADNSRADMGLLWLPPPYPLPAVWCRQPSTPECVKLTAGRAGGGERGALSLTRGQPWPGCLTLRTPFTVRNHSGTIHKGEWELK